MSNVEYFIFGWVCWWVIGIIYCVIKVVRVEDYTVDHLIDTVLLGLLGPLLLVDHVIDHVRHIVLFKKIGGKE